MFVEVLKEENVVAIELEFGHSKLLVVSVYLWPGQHGNPSVSGQFETLRAMIQGYPNSIIILGDFNAKSPVWGHPFRCNRGGEVLDFAASLNLSILNQEDSEPTFVGPQGSSWIDLTLARLGPEIVVQNWQVDDCETATNHRRLTMEILVDRTKLKQIRFKVKNLVWSKLRFNLKREFNKLSESYQQEWDTDHKVRVVTKTMQSACNSSTKRQSNRGMVPWWSVKIKVQRNKVKACRKRFQRCLWDEEQRRAYKDTYRREQAKLKKAIRQAKCQSWREFLSSVRPEQPFGPYLKSIFNRNQGALSLHQIKWPDGTTTMGLESNIRTLMEYHFPIDDPSQDDPDHSLKRSAIPALGADDPPFTVVEVKKTKEHEQGQSSRPGWSPAGSC